MKTIMKKAGIIFCALAVISFTLASCSKDKDPVESDFFIGKYKGAVSYIDGSTNISKEDGSVEVVKHGDTYEFLFSDGIPNITGVKFKKDGEHTVINVGSDESHYIHINADKLDIAYTTGDKVWTANCTR